MRRGQSKRRRIVILGGAASGIIISETIKICETAGAAIELQGFLNDDMSIGSHLAGYRILGPFGHWAECPPDTKFISAVMKPGHALQRFARIKALGIPDNRWASIVHPAASVAASAAVGYDTFIGATAVVESGSMVGNHCHIRGGSYVSHDARLDDFVFVGPNATVLGRCVVGEGVHLGANAVCRDQISIGNYSLIGIGAVVTGNVPAFAIMAGNPARRIGFVENSQVS